MIFVTTGTSKLPFERFVREVDRLAGAGAFGGDRVLLQYRGSDFQPQHCERVDALDFGEMLEAVGNARLVLGHGGAGTRTTKRPSAYPSIPTTRRWARWSSVPETASASKRRPSASMRSTTAGGSSSGGSAR